VTDEPYTQLVALAEREHGLTLRGDFETLERLAAQRDALIAALPETPPASARPALIEAARIQALTTAALNDARTRLAAEMAITERGRQTAAGYSRAVGSAPRGGTITVAA
jgi:HEAT repeat protein